MFNKKQVEAEVCGYGKGLYPSDKYAHIGRNAKSLGFQIVDPSNMVEQQKELSNTEFLQEVCASQGVNFDEVMDAMAV
jgi:hypothetical protein